MKTIVILGAGVAGMPLIRQTMRNVVLKSSEYKLIAVSPNTEFFWNFAVPRMVVPGQFADEQIFFPLAPAFKDFPADKFEFIVGTASSLDPDTNTVAVGDRKIEYHTLIVATGSTSTSSFPWKTVGNTEETKRRLHQVQKEITGAKAVVVSGGGTTGVETAGELAYEFSRVGKKDVYFIYGESLPLTSATLDKVRKRVVLELERQNVMLIPDTKVTNTTLSANGATTLELQKKDGSTRTLTVGAYIPATGLAPNSSFVPAKMLDATGHIKQNGDLRAEKYPRIFVVGDVGALEVSKATIADEQCAWLVKHLPAYFTSGRLPGEPYKKDGTVKTEMLGVTLGRSRAAGQLGTWMLPSIMLWWFKGRHLGTDFAADAATGRRSVATVFEK